MYERYAWEVADADAHLPRATDVSEAHYPNRDRFKLIDTTDPEGSTYIVCDTPVANER
jgi:hypothetical protein